MGDAERHRRIIFYGTDADAIRRGSRQGRSGLGAHSHRGGRGDAARAGARHLHVREHPAPRLARRRGGASRRAAARPSRRLGRSDPSGLSARRSRTNPRSARCFAPISSPPSIAIRRRRVSASRCSTTRAFTPSRRIGWRTGCSARAARISRSIFRAARRQSSSATSIRPPASAAASSSITPPAWSSAKRR